MFQWYKKAVVCYAFLEDLVPGDKLDEMLPLCRWFSRGWTLQELLAPSEVEFFNKNWEFIGSRAYYSWHIHHYVHIDESVLLGSRDISSFCVAQKMSWAAGRQTKRLEDIAYCLLGIFDVNMPLIYGEGEKAFRRLQEEIVKHDNDLTILAWNCLPGSQERFIGCFAPSPANFAGKDEISPFHHLLPEFSTTNKGLFLNTEVSIGTRVVRYAGQSPQTVYWMSLGSTSIQFEGIYLRKLTGHLYCRLEETNMEILETSPYIERIKNFHIVINPGLAKLRTFASYRTRTVRVPPLENIKVKMALPTAYWDHTDNLFLNTDADISGMAHVVFALDLQVLVETESVPVTLFCYWDPEPAECNLGVVEDGGPFPQTHLIYADRYKELGVPWDIIGYHESKPWPLNDHVTVQVKGRLVRLRFSLETIFIDTMWGDTQTYDLTVSTTRL